MKIYNYVLYSRGTDECEFREEVIEDAQPSAEGWIVSKGAWDTTRYYKSPNFVSDIYAMSISVATETPLKDAKSELAAHMYKKISDDLYNYVVNIQARLEKINKCVLEGKEGGIMWTLDDLKKADMQPYKACWITYEGYKICKLVRWHNFLNDDDAFVFIPNYEEWEKVDMIEIDGINEELRLPQYVRMRLPALLYKRYVPTSRPEWPEYMRLYGMPEELGRDQWELMMYSHGKVREDNFRMERCDVDEPVKGYKEVCNGLNSVES